MFWVFYSCLCFMLVLFAWVALVLLFVLCNDLAFCDWCRLGWVLGLVLVRLVAWVGCVFVFILGF